MEQLYYITFTNGIDKNNKCLQYIWNAIKDKYHEQIVTESVKNNILEEVNKLHDQFFVENTRVRKDKNYKYVCKLITWLEKPKYVVILSEDVNSSCIYFTPKKIIDIVDGQLKEL